MLRKLFNTFDKATLTTSEVAFWSARAQQNAASRWNWLRVVWASLMMLAGVWLFVYEFFAVMFNFNIWGFFSANTLRNTPGAVFSPVLMALVFTGYTIPQQRARLLATQIIARDKTRTHNWELIVLTGVDARSYVRAKWWTIVRLVAPQILPAAIIRAGLIAFGIGELTRASAFQALVNVPNGIIDAPSPLDILLIGVLSAVLTFSSVIGIAAGSLDDALESPRHGNVWWKWMARGWISFGETSLALMGMLIVLTLISFVVGINYNLFLIAMIFWTALDNGWIVTGQLAVYTFMRLDSLPSPFLIDPLQVLMIVLLSLPLSALRLWIRLRLAERSAQRYQLVPPPTTPKDAV